MPPEDAMPTNSSALPRAAFQPGSISRIALGLGLGAVLCALGIGLVAYRVAIHETETRRHRFYLSKARMLARDAELRSDLSDEELLEELGLLWSSSGERPADEYICIVDQDARLVLHSAHPKTVGNNAGKNIVGEGPENDRCTLRDLVETRQDFVGDYVSSSGQEQVAAFAHIPQRNWTLGVHRSKEALVSEVRSGMRGLAVGFLLVCGLLMPASLAMLAEAYRISQRKRFGVEAEREKLIEQLESQNAELERFAYTVSHDLKAPLITVKSYLGALREDLGDEDHAAVDDDIDRMSRAADNMHMLLEDLLELSRIGRLVAPAEEMPLEELVRNALERVEGQLANAGVSVNIADDLPVLLGDRHRLVEVLQNLIDNAAKYMGDQPNPRIEIGAERSNDEVVCFVNDNGMGIDPAYHDKVFGLFDQLDGHSEGSGVGLALVKRIVEVHGGRIWVESVGLGHGTRFNFTLPSNSQPVSEKAC